MDATGASLDFIDPKTGQPKCYPITGTGSNGVTINTIGTQNVTAANAAGLGLIGPVVGGAGSSGTTFNRWRPNTSVTTGVVGFEGVGGGSNNLNVRDTFEPRMLAESLISPGENTTTFIQATYDLDALGSAQLYFDFLGHRRESQQTNYRQLALDYRLGSPLIPPSLAFSDFGADQGPKIAVMVLTPAGPVARPERLLGIGHGGSPGRRDAASEGDEEAQSQGQQEHAAVDLQSRQLRQAGGREDPDESHAHRGKTQADHGPDPGQQAAVEQGGPDDDRRRGA